MKLTAEQIEALQLLDQIWYASFKRAELNFRSKATRTKTRVVNPTENQ